MSTTNGNPQKSTNTASSEDEDKQARIALQRIITMSLLAGLCPAIPIPFLDDMALRFIRKRALRSEFERQGLRPGRAQLDVFLQERSRLLGCLSSILIYPIKKTLSEGVVRSCGQGLCGRGLMDLSHAVDGSSCDGEGTIFKRGSRRRGGCATRITPRGGCRITTGGHPALPPDVEEGAGSKPSVDTSRWQGIGQDDSFQRRQVDRSRNGGAGCARRGTFGYWRGG